MPQRTPLTLWERPPRPRFLAGSRSCAPGMSAILGGQTRLLARDGQHPWSRGRDGGDRDLAWQHRSLYTAHGCSPLIPLEDPLSRRGRLSALTLSHRIISEYFAPTRPDCSTAANHPAEASQTSLVLSYTVTAIGHYV